MTDLPRGRIKETPEDFVVEEIPAYVAVGAGDHVFVTLRKRDVTTLDAVRALASACGCDPREAGFAGMKDRRAVATQTISLKPPRGVPAAEVAGRARALSHPAIHVLDATLHGNKLKPGHLTGNRFDIRIRDVPRDRVGDVVRAFEAIRRDGVPNAFGSQRFGKAGDNADRALAWLTGKERAPRDARIRRLHWSSLQSAVFNEVLDARVADGTWTTPLEGDLLKLHTSGGLFVCTAVQTDRERAARGEVSPTGPLVGARMRWPTGAPGDLEHRIGTARLGESFDLARTRALGEGSRRVLRLWVEDLRWEIFEPEAGHGSVGVRVWFVLPKGGYATTVLGTAVTIDETGESASASLPLPEEGPSDAPPDGGGDGSEESEPLHDSTRDPRSLEK
jgi:tRNA pseudouridine13 synthase